MEDTNVDDTYTLPETPTGSTCGSKAGSTGGSSTPKRKASPHIVSTPHLKIQKTPGIKSKPSQKNVPFSDLLLKTFKEKKFIEGFAPFIQALICPFIQTAVDETSKRHDRAISDMIASNTKIYDLVQNQMDRMEEQNRTIESQAAELKVKDEKIRFLEKRVENLDLGLQTLKNETNDLQQYGRRNSLRLNNMKADPDLDEESLTHHVVGFLNKNLTPETPIRREDVERCHPVGRSEKKQILVKFCHYKTKHMVYSSKKKLKGNTDKVFITEDLIKQTHEQLIKPLLELKKSDKIDSFWTHNGKVFYKKNALSSSVSLRSKRDIEAEGLA